MKEYWIILERKKRKSTPGRAILMKTANIDFSLKNEKCSRCPIKYMRFILRAGKRMRHDITETMALLNNHKTFVCSASLHSFYSQWQQSVDRLSLNEMLTMMDDRGSLSSV